MHLDPFDVVRLGLGAGVLAFASYTDWRWRRAPNALWWLAGGVGALLLLAEVATDPARLDAWPLLAAGAVFAGLMVGMYRLGLIAGGADAKALVALALLAPWPLHLGFFPLREGLLPPAFGVLGNALIAFLAVPLGLMAVNLARGHARFPHALVGLRMPLEAARRRHMWPMEHVDEEGRVRTAWMPSRYAWTDEDWDALAKAGREDVWVTPKVPFMIPLLAGFVAAFLVGDLWTTWILPLPPP